MPTYRKSRRHAAAGDRPGTHEPPARSKPQPAHARKRKLAAKRQNKAKAPDERQFYEPERWDGLG